MPQAAALQKTLKSPVSAPKSLKMPPSNSTPALETIDWGRTEYQAALERQKALVGLRRTGEAPDTLVFTEHAPVFTIGMRKGAEQHLIWNEAQLKAKGVQVIRSNRGGDAGTPGRHLQHPANNDATERVAREVCGGVPIRSQHVL